MKIKPSLLLLMTGGTAFAAPIPLSSTTVYTQNFDAMAMPATAGDAVAASTWADDSTIPGWYCYKAGATTVIPGFAGAAFAYRTTDGSAGPTVGNLYSMGVAGSTDRAFATPTTTAAGEMSGIVVFQNTGTTAIDLTNLAYNAEVLRTNSAAANIESITVWYTKAATQAALLTLTQAAVNTTVFPATVETTPTSNYVTGWTRLSEMDYTLPAQATLGQVNLTTTVSKPPTAQVRINAGEFFAIRWSNINDAGTDADLGIDDVALTFTVGGGPSINATAATNIVRVENGPGAADDTVTFDTIVTQSGAGASWTATGATPASGAYGPSVRSMTIAAPLPAGPVNVVFTDPTSAATTTISVAIPARYVIGQTNFGSLQDLYSSLATPPAADWTANAATRTLTMHPAASVAADQIVTSATIDLTSVGTVSFTANFRAYETSTGSNFEIGDKFKAELIYTVAGTPTTVNLIADPAWDVGDGAASAGTNGAPNGYLNGFTGTNLADYDANTARDEFNRTLQGGVALIDNTFPLAATIPANADSVVLKIYGAGINGTESFDVSDVLFAVSNTSSLTAIPGTAVWNNGNTVDPADDKFSVPVTVTSANIGASPGWLEIGNPSHTGLYSVTTPFTFGPYPGRTPITGVQLEDQLVSTTTSAIFTLSPPAAALTASLVAGTITRVPNGAGDADDTVTFEILVAGTNVGPAFTATTNTLSSTTVTGAANYPAVSTTPVTLTLHDVPNSGYTVNVVIADASYPTAPTPVTISVAIPAVTSPVYVIGQKNFGAGVSDVTTTGAYGPEWINFPGSREQLLNGGGATDKITTSEVLDLSAVGTVNFTATFLAKENSTGSNFEGTDKFKAEILIDGGLIPANVINLITPYDTGAGLTSTVAPGTNGTPDGYMNGYQGTVGTDFLTSVAYTTTAAEYDANQDRDEFNGLPRVAAAGSLNHAFSLSAVIPPSANTVQLKIYGQGAGGTEAFILKDVLFSTSSAPADTDSDGLTDAYEDANGLNKNSAADKFLDKDGDGVSNYAEFLAGTAANDPNSVLHITGVSKAGNLLTVTFPAIVGKTYQVELSSPLSTGVWTPTGAVLTAASAAGSITVPVTGTKDFARVRVNP